MKLYRLTILGQGPLDQLISYESAFSAAVADFRRATKMASATAARIERADAVPTKGLFMKAVNHQPLGLKFETVVEWDRVNGTTGLDFADFTRLEHSAAVNERSKARKRAIAT